MKKRLDYSISAPAGCIHRLRLREPVHICTHPIFEGKKPFVLLCNCKYPEFPEDCPLATQEEGVGE